MLWYLIQISEQYFLPAETIIQPMNCRLNELFFIFFELFDFIEEFMAFQCADAV
jgi:hypothetical protein